MADLSEPRQATAPISVLPQQKAFLAAEKPAPTATLTPEPQPPARIANIPIWLCWALLAASVTILILQIWNYFS